MYAYLDQYGVLHAVETKETAEQYTKSKIIETTIPCGGGYPLVSGTKDDHVIVETKDGIFKVNGTEHPIADLEKKYPDVASLVAKFF